MSKTVEKLKTLLVASFLVSGISACGGGGDKSSPDDATSPVVNNAPIANQDTANSINGNTVIVDVLSNDIDSDGDEITITAISKNPENGVAVISNNGTQIDYTPNNGFLGIDAITYTISDGSLSGTAIVELAVSQSITLAGKVVDSLASGARVTAAVGTKTFETTTDEAGLYTLEISTQNLDEMVSVNAYGRAANNQEFVELVSVVESFSGLVTLDDGDNILTVSELHALNITQLSTALFLLAKDLNQEQLFTRFSDYESMLEQVNIDEVLQAAGTIKLLLEDSNYKPLLIQNLLTMFDAAAGELTVLAIEKIIQEAETVGIEEEIFAANIEAAIDQSLADVNVTQAFTPELLVNKRIVQTEAVRAGWIAPYGRVMEFADDGTFTLYRSSRPVYFGPTNNGTFITITGNWLIDGSTVDMTYTSEIVSEQISFDPTFVEISEQYGEDIALAFSATEGSFFQLESNVAESGKTLHLVVVTKNVIKVRIDTSITDTLILPQAVIDFLGDGRTEVSNITERSLGSDLRADVSTRLNLSTAADIEGDWVLNIPSFYAPESFNENDSIVDFITFGQTFAEKVELGPSGSTSTLFSDVEFEWSFVDGKIILMAKGNRLEYTPYYQLNKEWLTVIEHYQNNHLVDVFVDKITKFDETYTLFTENMISELPVIYNANITNHDNSLWSGDILNPVFIFGDQFSQDGSMIRNIRPIDESNNDEAENLVLSGNVDDWNWSRDNRKIVLRNISGIAAFWERYLDVVSTDSFGRAIIFEYSVIGFPEESRFISVPPRLNRLTKENLEQWPELWENSDLR